MPNTAWLFYKCTEKTISRQNLFPVLYTGQQYFAFLPLNYFFRYVTGIKILGLADRSL